MTEDTIDTVFGITLGILVIAFSLFIIALLVGFPLYLYRYISRRIRAPKTEAKKPSSKTLIFYSASVAMILIVGWLSIRFGLKIEASSRQAEPKTNLGAIYVAQLAYSSDTNTYAGGPEAFKLIAWEPGGQNRYAYYCDRDIIANKLPILGGAIKTPLPGRNWPFRVSPQSSRIGFTCMAVGNVDRDEFLDVWMINDRKQLTNPQNDLGDKVQWPR